MLQSLIGVKGEGYFWLIIDVTLIALLTSWKADIISRRAPSASVNDLILLSFTAAAAPIFIA